MATGLDGTSSSMTPRWWTPVCLLAIAGWVGAAFTGAYVWPGGDTGSRHAVVLYGALFFGLIFGYSIWNIRRTQLSERSELFDRLALTPVSPAALRASTRGLYRIGYVYLTLGIIVTGLGLGAIAAYGTAWESRLIYISIAIVAGWCVYMFYALRATTQVSDSVFAPLGLSLVAMPSYRIGLLHDMRSLEGAVVYAGNRRGRDVEIVLGIGVTATRVAGPAAGTLPNSARQMADLTGERSAGWRDVTVELADGDVLVRRTGRDSGKWMFHDLLLAESIATGQGG
ncbi:MAG TPA: hypothetical protein VNQ73_12855 [Ilumatobacter sp.]|nr:hypothetical protein [Ilumatobacter sp.]